MSQSINLNNPTCLVAPIVIGDPVRATNGSPDGLPTLPKVGGNPISAAIYLPTLYGALTVSSFTTAERNALNPFPGMIIYNLDTAIFEGYFNAAWDAIAAGIDTFTRIFLGDGSAANPSLTFTNDTDTGIYRAAGPSVAVTVGGQQSFLVDASGSHFVGINGSVGAARWYTDTNARYFEWTTPTNANLPASLSFEWPRSAPVLNNTPFVANVDGTTSFNSAGYLSAQATITSAQIQTLYDTPREVLPALSGNSTYFVHQVVIASTTGTNAYSGGGDLYLQYTDTPHITSYNASTDMTKNVLTTDGASRYTIGTPNIPAALLNDAVFGEGVYITNLTANFGGLGDGDLKVTVWYSVIDLPA